MAHGFEWLTVMSGQMTPRAFPLRPVQDASRPFAHTPTLRTPPACQPRSSQLASKSITRSVIKLQCSCSIALVASSVTLCPSPDVAPLTQASYHLAALQEGEHRKTGVLKGETTFHNFYYSLFYNRPVYYQL